MLINNKEGSSMHEMRSGIDLTGDFRTKAL